MCLAIGTAACLLGWFLQYESKTVGCQGMLLRGRDMESILDAISSPSTDMIATVTQLFVVQKHR